MVGIILGSHTTSATVAFSQLVAASVAIRVPIAPTWPFLQVAVVVLAVAVFAVVVVVVSASVLVQRRLYMGGQFLDCGGEFGVGSCELADVSGQ